MYVMCVAKCSLNSNTLYCTYVRVPESFVVVVVGWANAGHHDGLGVASQ